LSTEEQLNIIQELFKKSDGGSLKDQVMFWERPTSVKDRVEVLVCPQVSTFFRMSLVNMKLDIEVITENVQESIDAVHFKRDSRVRSPAASAYDPNEYNTLEDIYEYLEDLQSRCPDGFTCEIRNIGETFEGREIRQLSITREGENRKGIWMDSLFHAREWLAGATNLNIVERLISGFGSDEFSTRLLNSYDWYIVPVANPDGYVYTWTDDRFWRKNRTPNEGVPNCPGTDLNRNYNFRWGVVDDGTSDDPCSNLYFGPGAASELETQAIEREGQRLSGSILLWISWHSWDFKWLFPYASTDDNGNCMRSPFYEDIARAGQACVEAVEGTFGENEWIAGSFCEVLYQSSGVSIDWVEAEGISKYVYTPELRGPGFDAGPEHIGPSTEENWNGVIALINEIEAIEGSK